MTISESSIRDLRCLPTGESSISHGVSRALVKWRIRLIRKDVVSGDETELYQASPLAWGSSAWRFRLMETSCLLRSMSVTKAIGTLWSFQPLGDGADPVPRSRRPALGTVGVWTRDGKYVLGGAEETKSLRRIWAFPVDGGEPRKFDILFETIATADLSHDGKQLAFTGTQTMGEVWTIKNLLQRPRP